MEKKELSALDAYINRVYKMIFLMIPGACCIAGITITTEKMLGWYPMVSVPALGLFNLTNLIYLAIGFYYIHTGFDDNDIVIPKKLKSGKILFAIIIIIQWNYISYLIPSVDFWAFAFFFVIAEGFFFDWMLEAGLTVGIIVSIALSWIIRGDALMPQRDALFNPNLVIRIECLVLSLVAVYFLTYFGGKFLVEELEKYVNYDTLTHLLNRRTMDSYLQVAQKQAFTGKTTFCLLMIDIDDFKKVNDTYGHDCGDEVLKAVAYIVSCSVQKKDNVFRWGGEEILILLNADEETACRTAERIRKSIAADPIRYRGNIEVSVTVTIGVAPYRSGTTIQDMMDEADAKLYQGKRNGKNQVVCYIAAQT